MLHSIFIPTSRFSLLQLPHVHLNRPPKSFYVPMLLIIDIFKILGFITLFLCSEVGIAVMNAISNYIMEKQKSENKTPIMVNSKEKTSKCLPIENWKWCWTWNSLITEVYIVPRTGACRFGSVCATVLGSFHWQDRSGSTAPCQKPGPTINHTNPQRKLFTFSFSGFKTFSEENVLWTNLE